MGGGKALQYGEGLLVMPALIEAPAEVSTIPQLDSQPFWAATPLKARLAVLRAARHRIATMSSAFAAAISPDLARTPADTRAAELLPLLAACKFLEVHAETILAPRRLGRRGLPFWLSGVHSEVHRVPFGHVLVIGPSNYPLFLPGVQALEALAAGNAVTWKPGEGGQAVALLFADALRAAGLPSGLLHITGESVEAARQALDGSPGKVFFTGSATTGRLLLRSLAETLTPTVMELSGCDAVIILPSADIARVVKALTFGLHLNGSATCMGPRRVLLVDATPDRREAFFQHLRAALAQLAPVTIPGTTRRQLQTLLAEAVQQGALVEGSPDTTPILVTDVQPSMRLAQTDLFAPLLCILEVSGEAGILTAQDACPYALTTSVFGHESAARALTAKLTAGTILINDLIVPTADPRVPFGGRRESGFGVTRGAEGLLEMTAVQTIAIRCGKDTRHYEATTEIHGQLFDGIITATHAATWPARFEGLKQLMAAGKKLASRNKP